MSPQSSSIFALENFMVKCAQIFRINSVLCKRKSEFMNVANRKSRRRDIGYDKEKSGCYRDYCLIGGSYRSM